MSDSLQEKSNKLYDDNVQRHSGAADRVIASGRYKEQATTEPEIWKDIQLKLRLSSIPANSRVLDIGCGLSNIAINFVELAAANHWDMNLLDIPSVIRALKLELSSLPKVHPTFYEGTFPSILAEPSFPKSYNCILAYSVLHYVDDPDQFIDEASALLAPKGRLMIGDIPNITRKGRFLSSPSGRSFDAAYKGIKISEYPIYTDAQDFILQNPKLNTRLCDDFLLKKISQLRTQGFEAFLVEQPEGLPFSLTREDLVVVRHG